MAKCDQCGEEIPRESEHCPNCEPAMPRMSRAELGHVLKKPRTANSTFIFIMFSLLGVFLVAWYGYGLYNSKFAHSGIFVDSKELTVPDYRRGRDELIAITKLKHPIDEVKNFSTTSPLSSKFKELMLRMFDSAKQLVKAQEKVEKLGRADDKLLSKDGLESQKRTFEESKKAFDEFLTSARGDFLAMDAFARDITGPDGYETVTNMVQCVDDVRAKYTPLEQDYRQLFTLLDGATVGGPNGKTYQLNSRELSQARDLFNKINSDMDTVRFIPSMFVSELGTNFQNTLWQLSESLKPIK